jgi:CubicO group peptidase (beta-lactamase class C family)
MMMRRVSALAVSLILSAGARGALAQVADKPSPTLDGAKKVIAAAAEAKKLNAPGGVIAVVDDGGNLMALERWQQRGAHCALTLAQGLVYPRKELPFEACRAALTSTPLGDHL